jgi:hypothetical protein
MMPEERMYCPAMTVTVYDELPWSRHFGTHVQPTIARFLVELDTKEQLAAKMKPIIFTHTSKSCK